MAFPPNYNQERNNRARAKARKALEKQERRESKSAQRKAEQEPENLAAPTPAANKDQH